MNFANREEIGGEEADKGAVTINSQYCNIRSQLIIWFPATLT